MTHIEAQSSRQDQFARSTFKYFARLHERYGWPVYPVALLSYDWPRTPEPDCYTLSFPDRQILDFRFRTV